MVCCGIAMLALAWFGSYLSVRGRLVQNRIVLWLTFFSFPLPFIAGTACGSTLELIHTPT
jgi:cytochrome d ubiquinol oxidase subunit I